MLARIALLFSMGVLSVVTLVSGPPGIRTAEAEGTISQLTFSTQITGDNQPAGDVGIEFSEDNDGVIVTFSFENLPPGTQLSRIVRFNYNDDYNWDSDRYGRLTCCPGGGSGRYGFKVLKLTGSSGKLPGGAYSVFIYAGSTEVQHGGFGVRGREGSTDSVPGGTLNGENGNDND